MNASATIRADYIRASRYNVQPMRVPAMPPVRELEARPAQDHKLENFKAVNHIEHREQCERERQYATPAYDAEKGYNGSFMEFDEDGGTARSEKLKRMFTIFPVRDPTYLVAVIFALGSLDLVIDAFFDLLPLAAPESRFETQETIAIPSTVLIGSILFFLAGIFDIFGALNADRGTFETTKSPEGLTTKYRPALLGSKEWAWIPSREKFNDLLVTNLAFQAGLIVLFGGIIFMFGGITDFPGIIPESSPFFGFLVFGPQVVHGALFFIANALLALSAQEIWWKPAFRDAEWQGAFLNTVGGFGFMMAGFFLFAKEEVASGVAAMGGSWAFLIGSLVRWYAAMEFC